MIEFTSEGRRQLQAWASQADERTGDRVASTNLRPLDIASGRLIGSLHARHRAIEFRKFLITIDRVVPAHLDVHLVLDNPSTHKTPAIQR